MVRSQTNGKDQSQIGPLDSAESAMTKKRLAEIERGWIFDSRHLMEEMIKLDRIKRELCAEVRRSQPFENIEAFMEWLNLKGIALCWVGEDHNTLLSEDEQAQIGASWWKEKADGEDTREERVREG